MEAIKPIYLDNAATTQVSPEVVAAMSQVMSEDFGNPSSRHSMGLAAERHLRDARRAVAGRTGVGENQVVFTSGGTEANAIAMLTASRWRKTTAHLLISAVEHTSVIKSAEILQRQGIDANTIPVTAGGWVDPKQVVALLRPDTVLVAVMHVNNETGIEQPIEEISRAVKKQQPECRILVDAVQSFAWLDTDLDRLGADLLTLSAHKIHGPKGVGCLVHGHDLQPAPLWGGGDQERGLRPGTENLPGIVGLAKAIELLFPASDEQAHLSQRLEQAVCKARPDAYALGDPGRRVPHILAMAVPGMPTEVVINLLEESGLVASSGSACHSRRTLRSHVLDAMGIPRNHGVLRLSMGHHTSENDIERAAEILQHALERL